VTTGFRASGHHGVADSRVGADSGVAVAAATVAGADRGSKP